MIFNKQFYIISSIIFLICSYILLDVFIFKPKIENKIDVTKTELIELRKYLDDKIPKIDSLQNIYDKELKSLSLKNN